MGRPKKNGPGAARLHQRGRRKKDDDGERRTAPVMVHCTPSEKARLLAEAGPMAIGDYIRRVTLATAPLPAAGYSAAEMREMTFQLARLGELVRRLIAQLSLAGNNVNQLARIANETLHLPGVRDVRDELRALDAKIEAAMHDEQLLAIEGKIAEAMRMIAR